MEKTVATKKTVKVEPQQHHCESKSASAKVIAGDVDPVALDCYRCLHPLVPLVFQCAAGHVVCSSCHKAHDKCTAGNMLYNEKKCSSVAGSGSIADRVVKMGPCGGAGGDAWEMDIHGVKRIMKFVLWHDVMVDAMMVSYELDDGLAQIKLWGRPQAANSSEIYLEQDEYLIGVKGHVGDCKGWLRLRSLTLVSNQRTFGPYGTEEGAPFELPAAGGRIIGFHGRSGTFLDALGTYVKMDG